MSKIAIDCRFWGTANTGLGRYSQSLVTELLNQSQENKDHYYYLLVNQPLKLKPAQNYELIEVNSQHYSLKEQLVLPRLLNQLKPDLVHWLHFNAPVGYFGRQLVTIHDLTKHFFKGKQTTTRQSWFYWFKYLNYKLVFSSIVKRSTKIIVPSKFVKLQLIKVYDLPASKIKVIYEGVDKKFMTKSILQPENYLLYVGNLYPHKNVLTLVKAVAKYNQTTKASLKLKIVSSRDLFKQRFAQKLLNLGLDSVVEFVVQPTDQTLIRLYQQSLALVMPSLLEGFGLPGIEAMATGALVLAADASCLPEVYGQQAIYFQPKQVDDLVEKIKLVIKLSPVEREKKIRQAKNWSQQYDWGKTAKETLEVYEGCLSL